MFERFIVSLGLKKLEKVKYNKEEIFEFFRPKSTRDISMIKMMKNDDL